MFVEKDARVLLASLFGADQKAQCQANAGKPDKADAWPI
jgi:hypothetical protein